MKGEFWHGTKKLIPDISFSMTDHDSKTNLALGILAIQEHGKTLPLSPGVYRMLDEEGQVLYIGKAKSLKNRVISYTQPNRLTLRLQRMVSLTRSMEFILTQSETEALLLEAELIKQLKPRFNILLRDDKSFPYILLTTHHAYPQLLKHRGAKEEEGQYFGPFASNRAVNETLDFLTKVFKLRICSDYFFATRTRPCLQYHIKRCTAPCVQKISQEEYLKSVQKARDFLEGRTSILKQELRVEMELASSHKAYEKAALIRDQIRALTQVETTQGINLEGIEGADVFSIYMEGGKASIQVVFIRHGCHYGNKSYFPIHDSKDSPEQILSAFLAQFYLGKPIPQEIILETTPQDLSLLQQALSMKAGRKVQFHFPKKGQRFQILQHAKENAKGALVRKMLEKLSNQAFLAALQGTFHIESPLHRVEVYDNSHLQGTNPYGAMIVATPEGFDKKSYRKFLMPGATGGDDYEMMRVVLRRRFEGSLKEIHPDLILLDGGKGQLSVAMEVMDHLGLNHIPMVAISKGPNRNKGEETFHTTDGRSFKMEEDQATLYYLQRLRDEAHRFAIGAHRKGRELKATKSRLDSIPGIGPKRKKDLLIHFGSIREIETASVSDLLKVLGINETIAKAIYNALH